MIRFLIAGVIVYGLLLSATGAEARTNHLNHWASHDRHRHIDAARPSTGIYQCDERRCHEAPQFGGGFYSGDSLVSLAQSQLGSGAVYGRGSLWCGRFMNWALTRAGYHGTGSDLAKSFLSLPHTSPHVGAIAVLGRGRRSGHVGVVSGFDPQGNPIIISGNHGHRVGSGVYPRHRILAYVSPT